jgi:ribosomal protein S6
VTIKEIAVMGKKTLAYTINKQTDGVYLLATIESPPLQVADIQKRSMQREDVLRYLLVGQQKTKKGG